MGDYYLILEILPQILRNEEGKKLGLKVKEKSAVHKENDVKMSDAEVRKLPNLTSCNGDSIPRLPCLLALAVWNSNFIPCFILHC